MSLSELKTELEDEISKIMDEDFNVLVTETSLVPTVDSENITYPNLDDKRIKSVTINTCILYIDIRNSTQLNIDYNLKTLTRLYSAFMRSMTKAAQYFGGHVRNIIGDRVMVVFEEEDCFTNAVETAILLNSVSEYLLNKYFPEEKLEFGIGIDYGEMLVSKGGIRKDGKENAPYKSLVWLGKPANIASKLTDLANKSIETNSFYIIDKRDPGNKKYHNLSFEDFFRHDKFLSKQKFSRTKRSDDNDLDFLYSENYSAFPERSSHKTPKILMTEKVYLEYKNSNPNDLSVKENFWKKQPSHILNRKTIYGGSIIYRIFKS
ncbi:adenylate/guanylate cyclase domain-containing protein [Carnobacteriaceae bacterium 52-44]